MSELKPCPFCNHLPNDESLGEDGYYISCSNIDCESIDALSPKAWNTRPIEDALRAEIAALKEAQRWIPVSERLPDERTDVSVIFRGSNRTAYISQYDWNVYEEESYPTKHDEVTHWRPLPAEPEAE